jgi:hypothetical protein
MNRATELEFLIYFYNMSDFGPADSDVRWILKERFKVATGRDLPEGYDDE